METKSSNKGFPQICKVGGVDRPAHATATSELHSAFVGVLFDVGIHLSEFKLQLCFTVHIDASGINMWYM